MPNLTTRCGRNALFERCFNTYSLSPNCFCEYPSTPQRPWPFIVLRLDPESVLCRCHSCPTMSTPDPANITEHASPEAAGGSSEANPSDAPASGAEDGAGNDAEADSHGQTAGGAHDRGGFGSAGLLPASHWQQLAAVGHTDPCSISFSAWRSKCRPKWSPSSKLLTVT